MSGQRITYGKKKAKLGNQGKVTGKKMEPTCGLDSKD